MGRILTDLKVSNFGDVLTNREKIRIIEIKDALVDTGAAMLNLHIDQINELGLMFLRKVRVKTAKGKIGLVGWTGASGINEVRYDNVKIYRF